MRAGRSPVLFKIDLKLEPEFIRWVEQPVLRAAARAVLRQQAAAGPAELSLLITGDAALRDFNREFLGHDEVTDVLSFPSELTDLDSGRRYYGDIAIAYPAARRQARQAGHPVRAELQLLVVHGVLHLLGHDHARPDQKARMWAAQAAVLMALGAGISGPAEGRP